MVQSEEEYVRYSAARGYLGNLEEVQWTSEAATSTDAMGNTALHLAAGGNHKEVVEFLLKHGSSIDAVNRLGETALHRAAYRGCTEVVTVLLNAGADTAVVTEGGFTAQGLAHEESVKAQLPEDAAGPGEDEADDIGDDAGDYFLETEESDDDSGDDDEEVELC